jgi:hypothetical protein
MADTLQSCYGTLTTPFGVLGEFYDSLGHRGADYRRLARESIIAYDDFSIEYVGETGGLGWVVGARRLTLGGFAGFAHTYDPPRVGEFIAKGTAFAAVAGTGDRPGSLWSGPHIHTTDSAAAAQAAALGIRPLNDPAPIIARAIGATTAGGPVTPITIPSIIDTSEEDFIMWNFVGGGGDIGGVWIVGPRGRYHCNGQEFDLLKRLRALRVTVDGKLVEPPGGVQMNSTEMDICSAALAHVV